MTVAFEGFYYSTVVIVNVYRDSFLTSQRPRVPSRRKTSLFLLDREVIVDHFLYDVSLLYSDSGSGLEDETKQVSFLRHVTYKIGPSASFVILFTGQELTVDLICTSVLTLLICMELLRRPCVSYIHTYIRGNVHTYRHVCVNIHRPIQSHVKLRTVT